MTRQEIFNKVLNHLRKQGVQASTAVGACMYRGPNGTKCAVGCLIPDERYSYDLEWRSIGFLLNGHLEGVSNSELGMLMDMQQIHDSWSLDVDMTFMEHVEERFRTLAENYGLVYTAPSTTVEVE